MVSRTEITLWNSSCNRCSTLTSGADMVAGEEAIGEARSRGKIEGVQVPSYPGNMGDKTKEEIPEVIRVGGVQLM